MDKRIVEAGFPHIPYLAEHAFEISKREARILADMTLQEALEESLMLSDEAWTMLLDGEPVSMCGVRVMPDAPGVAQAWLISTPRVAEAGIFFLKASKRIVGEWLERYGTLANLVHSENAPTIAWADWLQFNVGRDDPVPCGDDVFFPCVRSR